MSERASSILSYVLVACALAVTASVVKRDFGATTTTGLRPGSVPDWQQYAIGGHIVGIDTASVAIVELADFECPVCRLLHATLDSLPATGVGFRLVYRHFPLRGHRFAVPAIRASECVAQQGRFAAIHDILFRYADSLGFAPWWFFARSAGVRDSVRFGMCIRATTPIASLAANTRPVGFQFAALRSY